MANRPNQTEVLVTIAQVNVGGSPGPDIDGDADIDEVTWDVLVQRGGTVSAVTGLKTTWPVPTGYRVDASQAVYRNKRVPAVVTGKTVEPCIPVYPATQDCDGTAPISTALDAARRSGSTLSLDARIAQTVQRVLQSMNQ